MNRICLVVFVLLGCYIESVTSHALCTDGFTATPQLGLNYCTFYRSDSCCTNSEDTALQNQVSGYSIADGQCLNFIKNLTCTECDPWSAHLLGEGVFKTKVPALCPTYCQNLYAACSTVDMGANSPFDSPRIVDRFPSVTDFCNAYPPIDSYCYGGSPYTPPPASGSQAWTPNGICVDLVIQENGLSGPTGFITFAAPPGTDDRVFVASRAGLIIGYRTNATGPFTKLGTFLDLTSKVSTQGEGGLLGLAFHPNFAANRKFYVSWICDPAVRTECRVSCSVNNPCIYGGTCNGGFCNDNNLLSVIEEYQVNAGNPNVAEPNPTGTVLRVSQPGGNHKAGDIHFGPDGYLYIFFGDGGGFASKGSQRRDMHLGKILRIDVDFLPFTVPSDNPFVGVAGTLPEIWAIGFRNPWRGSFDRLTGQLFVGDVGQDTYEEVNIVEKGKNYGWGGWEGFDTFPRDTVNQSLVTFPVTGYYHAGIACVIGGILYRGPKDTCHQGVYLFNDQDLFRNNTFLFARQSGNSWTLESASWSCTSPRCKNLASINTVNSWGQDNQGNAYFLSGGNVFQVVELENCPLLHCGARSQTTSSLEFPATTRRATTGARMTTATQSTTGSNQGIVTTVNNPGGDVTASQTLGSGSSLTFSFFLSIVAVFVHLL